MDDNIDDLADVLGLPITQMANRIVDNDKNKASLTQPDISKSSVSEDSEPIRRLIIENSRTFLYEKIRRKRQ